MPKKMDYSNQTIILLCPSLKQHVERLQRKRLAATDISEKEATIEHAAVSRSMVLPGKPVAIPAELRTADSRMIIVAHGLDFNGTKLILDDGIQVPPIKLLEWTNQWLGGSKIKRIVLHTCYGAGWDKIGLLDSFAARFAAFAGNLTVDITARRGPVTMGVRSKGEGGDYITSFRTVGGKWGEPNRTYVFTPNPLSSFNPRNQISLTVKNVVDRYEKGRKLVE